VRPKPAIKIHGRVAERPRVSTNDPFPPHPAGQPTNQFGTPAGQFGAPANQFGTPGGTAQPTPFGYSGAPAAGWGTPPPPAKRGLTGPTLVALALGLALLVGGGLAVRYYVFPDLSKPIDLPAVAAGLAQNASAGNNSVTIQAKDADGRAQAMAVYADDQTRPTTVVMLMAGRGVKGSKDFSLPTTMQVSKVGKLTCSAETDSSTLLGSAPQASGSLKVSGLATGAVCWRSNRHLTLMAGAFSANGSARVTAIQAVNDAWRAQ
jgi:hypothetical protein